MAGTIGKVVARGRAIPWLALYESARFIYRHGKAGVGQPGAR